ncbi:PhoU domain-containing protein [Tardisphaera saccharovorans]
MEYRKIQRTGGSSYTISLPKEWVEENKLKEGDALGLQELRTGELLIMPSGKRHSFGDFTLDIKENEEPKHLLRTLVALYLKGYSTINVRSRGFIQSETRRVIMDFKSLVIGVEILEERQDAVVLRDLVATSDLDPLRIMDRMASMVKSDLAELRPLLKKPLVPQLEEIMQRDSQIDKMYLFIAKEFNRALYYPWYEGELGVSVRRLSSMRNVSKQIERIGDHIESACRLLSEYGNPITEGEIDELLQTSVALFDDAYRSYSSSDLALAQSVVDEVESAAEKYIGVLKKYESAGSIYAFLVGEDLRRILFYSSDIAEAAIDDAVGSGEMPTA